MAKNDSSARLRSIFGAKVHARRKELGWKQETLARAVGYETHASIVRIEKGEILPSFEKAIAIAAALDIGLMDLVDAEGFVPPRAPAGNFAATESAALLLPFFARKECADMLRVLAEDVEALPRPGAPR